MLEVWIIVGVVLLLLIVVGAFVLSTRKSLRRLDERVETAWSDLRVQLDARASILPQLESKVQAHAAHDTKVFATLDAARSESSAAETPDALSAAENRMQGAIRGLFAASESYPQLQSSREFLQLQSDLVDVENRIQTARRFYNGGVREHNTKVKVFPSSVIAKSAGLGERGFFEVADRAAISQPPRVQF